MTCSSRSSGTAEQRAIARPEERRRGSGPRRRPRRRCRESGPAAASRPPGPPVLAPWGSAWRDAIGSTTASADRVAARSEPECLGGLVVLEDRAAVGPRQLVGAGTIVWSTVSRSRVELSARPTSPSALSSPTDRVRSRSGPEFLEQPDVLDRDDRLVSERLEQLDLVVGERPRLGPRHRDDTDGRALPQHRYPRGRFGSRLRALIAWCAYSGSTARRRGCGPPRV